MNNRWIWMACGIGLLVWIALDEAISANNGAKVVEHRVSQTETDLKESRRNADRLVAHFEALEQSTDRIIVMLQEMRAEMPEVSRRIESR